MSLTTTDPKTGRRSLLATVRSTLAMRTTRVEIVPPAPEAVRHMRATRLRSATTRHKLDRCLKDAGESVRSLASFARSTGETPAFFVMTVPVKLLDEDREDFWSERASLASTWGFTALFGFAALATATWNLAAAAGVLALGYAFLTLILKDLPRLSHLTGRRLPPDLRSLDTPMPGVHVVHAGKVSWFWTGDRQIRTLVLKRSMEIRLSETELSVWDEGAQVLRVPYPLAMDEDLEQVDGMVEKLRAEIAGAWR